MKKNIQIMLVDDHPLVLEGISSRLQEEVDIEVVGQASNGQEALDIMSGLRPDVVLMDVTMPVMDGLEAVEHFQREYPDVRILMLSMHDDPEYIIRVMGAGAAGYVLKDVSSDELVNAIRTIFEGNTYFSSRASENLFRSPQRKELKTDSALTKRERTVLTMVAEGHCNKKIATLLGISVRTVETHRQNIKSKLGINTPAGLTKYAIEYDLIKILQK